MRTHTTRLMLMGSLLTLAGCGDGPGEGREVLERNEQAIGKTPFSMGLVTGDIYAKGSQQLADPNFRGRFVCEMQQLGTQYVRIESDWTGVSPLLYREIVGALKNKGIRVIVVVAGQAGLGCNKDQLTFRNDYKNHLIWLTQNVFSQTSAGDFRPWAYEIGNEPNQTGAGSGCKDGAPFRIKGDTFAWLLRDVYNWKLQSQRDEKIISGGIMNTYWSEEPFWNDFFGSYAMGRHFWAGGNQWIDYTGRPPYDYFGIHPYNHVKYDQACINANSTNCFANWQSTVTNGLKGLAAKLNQVNSVSKTAFIVTEFGWQNRGVADGNNASVKNEDQMVAGMNAAGEAFQAVGPAETAVVHSALWYNYRDDVDKFGLRGPSNPVSATKAGPWHKFRYMATGLNGGIDSHGCYY